MAPARRGQNDTIVVTRKPLNLVAPAVNRLLKTAND
jgi:hypothetical protein